MLSRSSLVVSSLVLLLLLILGHMPSFLGRGQMVGVEVGRGRSRGLDREGLMREVGRGWKERWGNQPGVGVVEPKLRHPRLGDRSVHGVGGGGRGRSGRVAELNHGCPGGGMMRRKREGG